MGFSNSGFDVRKRIGQWGEDTFTTYFSTHPEARLTTLPYGEAYSGRKKQKGDAVARPDLLIVETDVWQALVEGNTDKADQDLRKLPDDDPWVREIVSRALVAAEVKFSHRAYVEGRVRFIVDEVRKKNYSDWLGRTEGIGEIVFWMTTTHAFMAPIEQVLREGEQKVLVYESQGRGKARSKNTWNLPVEKGLFFGEVTYELNRSLVPRFRMNSESGAIDIELTDPPGSFVRPDIPGLRDLAAKVRR